MNMFWELLEAVVFDCFSGNKFWSSQINTENMMSHLYFNEKSDYLKEKMKSFAPP